MTVIRTSCKPETKKKTDSYKEKMKCMPMNRSNQVKLFGEKKTFIITRVKIEKGNDPFGITISGGIDQPTNDGISNSVAFVHTVSTNKNSSVFDKLYPGDCILSIDGQLLEGMTHNQIVNLFSNKVGTVILEVKRDVKTANNYEKFRSVIIKHTWDAGINGNGDYGFEFELTSWPSYCHPDIKNVVVLSVDPDGPAYGTILPKDVIITINNQILFGYTHIEVDQMIRKCNGKVILEVQRLTKPDSASVLVGFPTEKSIIGASLATSQMREVKLKKEPHEKFGFGIIGGVDDCPLFVANVDPGSHAKAAGIKCFSVIHRMNSKDVSFMSHGDAVKIIKNSNELNLLLEYNEKLYHDFHKFINGYKNPATIKLRNHSTYRGGINETDNKYYSSSLIDQVSTADSVTLDDRVEPLQQFTVKALFDFDSSTERSLPARGLSFKFGDIIKVTNGNDNEWWQALLLNYDGSVNNESNIGLIPSLTLMSYRCNQKEKKVKFTGKVDQINHKNTISISTQKNAVKKLSNKIDHTNSIVKKIPHSMTTFSDSSNYKLFNEKTIQSNVEMDYFYQLASATKMMYIPVESIQLNDFYKRPIFIVGPYASRVLLTLEQTNPNIYQFLPYNDNNDNKDTLLEQTIQTISELADKGVHALIIQDKVPLHIVTHFNFNIILIMFEPPSIEWMLKRQKHLSYEEARTEFNNLNQEKDKYRPFFTRIFPAPDAFEDALQATIDTIEENNSNLQWIPRVTTVMQF